MRQIIDHRKEQEYQQIWDGSNGVGLPRPPKSQPRQDREPRTEDHIKWISRLFFQIARIEAPKYTLASKSPVVASRVGALGIQEGHHHQPQRERDQHHPKERTPYVSPCLRFTHVRFRCCISRKRHSLQSIPNSQEASTLPQQTFGSLSFLRFFTFSRQSRLGSAKLASSCSPT